MNINFQNLGLLIKSFTVDRNSSSSPQVLPNESVNTGQQLQVSAQAYSNNVQFNILNRMQQAILFKELLNLPKEWKELLAMLVYKEVSPETLVKLLDNTNNKVLIQDLKQMLTDNSREVINKLLKLTQPTPGNIQNIEQLKEIISLISHIMPTPNATPKEVLTNVILLYLPWLPLSQQPDIAMRFEKSKLEEEQQENISLIMYVSTLFLGRFKAMLIINADGSLNIEIENIEFTDNHSYLDKIAARIKQELSNDKIPSNIKIYSDESSEEYRCDKREISIHPAANISPRVMMAAYLIAKVIFEADERVGLLKHREEIVQSSH